VRKLTTSLQIAVLAAVPLAAAEFKGWISDSSCGASNASGEAANRDCAERCLKEGAKPVLVTDGDGKVLQLAGKVDVKDHMRHKVKITGNLKGETVTVTSIAKAD
jgi:hypothetical protein